MLLINKKELEFIAEKSTSDKMKKWASVHANHLIGKQQLGIENDTLSVQAGEKRIESIAPSKWTPTAEDFEEELGYKLETI